LFLEKTTGSVEEELKIDARDLPGLVS